MKNLIVLLLLASIFSCTNGVESHRASIEELATNWAAATTSVTDFGASVQAAATAQTEKVAAMAIDEAAFAKLKPEQQTQVTDAKMAAEAATSGFTSILSEVGTFVSDWTTKGAKVTALTEGLAAGKIEGDVTAQIAELTGMITDATGSLETWKTALSAAQATCDSSNESLSALIASLVK